MRTIVAWSVLAAVTLGACSEAGSTQPSAPPSAVAGTAAPAPPSAVAEAEPLRLVVMGDGYTLGNSTGAPNRDSWWAQLQQVTRHGEMRIRVVGRLAESGATSRDVLIDQLPNVASNEPDMVTVQVGANDIFTGVPVEEYAANIEGILDGLLEVLPARRIFAITTPDHELTERGRSLGPYAAGSDDVRAVNDALEAAAAARGITVIDIAPIYDLVVEDPTLVIDGGPDPSARQYAGWVEIIGQHMRRSLSASDP